jgi:hypothetical protein
MDCCILSAEEVGQLRSYNIQPSHKNHPHLSSKEIIEMVKREELEFIEMPDGRYCTTPVKTYFLVVKKSGGIPVVQRIVSNHLKHLSPPRF